MRADDTAWTAYQTIRDNYHALRVSPVRRAERQNWLALTSQLEALLAEQPSSPPRMDARMRYTLGMMYFGLYGELRNVEDLRKAHDILSELALRYPNNPLADDALFFRGEILHKLGDDQMARRVLLGVLENYPDGNRVDDTQYLLAHMSVDETAGTAKTGADAAGEAGKTANPGGVSLGTTTGAGQSSQGAKNVGTAKKSAAVAAAAQLKAVKVWTNPDYTRLALEIDRKVRYSHGLREPEEGREEGTLLEFKLEDVVLSEAFEQTLVSGEAGLVVPVSGGLLHELAIARPSGVGLRLSLELGPLRNYRVTPFQNPYRILIDLFGEVKPPDEVDPLERLVLGLDGKEPESSEVAGAQDSTPSFVVVIDAGHGGNDPGAIGPSGIKEKDVVLSVARRTRKKLESLPGVKVVMTRDSDEFVPLETRTQIGNRFRADLFVSIHANALPSPSVHGIETYYLDNASDEAAARLAAQENATLKDAPVLDYIVQDLVISGNVEYSRRLARVVHESLVSGIRRNYEPDTVKDLGVKSALFYVLFGTQMPSILVEVSFISNPIEEFRLSSERYQEEVADAIRGGIQRYRTETNALTRAGETGQ